jgi:hypothetical protein
VGGSAKEKCWLPLSSTITLAMPLPWMFSLAPEPNSWWEASPMRMVSVAMEPVTVMRLGKDDVSDSMKLAEWTNKG